MTTTNHLSLPYMAEAQSQKHVTFNEALRQLDALVQISVLSRTEGTPPDPATEGSRYIVASPASGDWAGQEGSIAARIDGVWSFHQPQEGWIAWDEGAGEALVHAAGAWSPLTTDDTDIIDDATRIGVNTSADATNRLAVKSDAILFSHDDVTPGSGDTRLVINKSASGQTASLTFQDNYEGRAEIGLTGDDHLHVKVSADGSSFQDAVLIENDTGRVSFPRTDPFAPTTSGFHTAKTKIDANEEDVTLLFIGDSTGNDEPEWIIQFTLWLGQRYSTHSVEYYWNDGDEYRPADSRYGTTGSGPNHIRIYNASVGGFHIGRWMAGRYAHAIAPVSPDVLITNDGINLSATSRSHVRRQYLQAFQQILLDKPGLPIVSIFENPFIASNAMDQVVLGLRDVAAHLPGMTLIDAHSRWRAAGRPAEWYKDTIHPQGGGVLATLNEVIRHWEAAFDPVPEGGFDPWWVQRDRLNLLPNGDFALFDKTVPDFWWTADASAVSKDTAIVVPGKTHSLKLSGSGKQLSLLVQGKALDAYRGRRLTLAAQLQGASGGDETTARAAIIVKDPVQGSVTSWTNDLGTLETDAWIWQIIDNITVPQAATEIEVILYSSLNGQGTAYFDEVVLYEGNAVPSAGTARQSDADNSLPYFSLLDDGGRFSGSPEPDGALSPSFVSPGYLAGVNGATLAEGPKYIYNSQTFGGTADPVDADIVSLVEKTKDANYRRYGVEYYSLDITAGSSQSSTPLTVDSVTHYLTISTRSAPLPPLYSLAFYVLVTSGSLAYKGPVSGRERVFRDGNLVQSEGRLLPGEGWTRLSRHFNWDTATFNNYDSIMPRLYATAGTTFLFALPVLTPGHPPEDPTRLPALIPSLRGWR